MASEIFGLIQKVMQDIGVVGKSRKNEQQGYAFRGIDDFLNAVHPVLAKHGIFPVPEVLEHSREERRTQKGGILIYTIMRVKVTFFAPDGSSVSAVTVGEGMDSGDKSANKAQSAALKYALIQTFCVPTNELHDSEEDSPQVAPRQQPAKPVDSYRAALHAAFRKRGFTSPEEKVAVTAALSAMGANDVSRLTPEQQRMLLEQVQAGQADRYKSKQAETAGK